MTNDRDNPFIAALVTGLSNALGQAIALDESGQIVLEFEGDIEIVLAANGDLITVRSALVPLTGADARAALAMNYGRLPSGMGVALDERSDLLVLLWSAEPEALSPDRVVAQVAQMVATVPQLKGMLARQDTVFAEPPPHDAIKI
jgi:hypothetical protein